jgi:DNA-directed RNA polymerase subunit L
MIKAETIDGISAVSASARINHPMADEIMILIGHKDRCNFPFTVEIALFKGSQWVNEPIPQFAGYETEHEYGMRMYSHVPLKKFADFLTFYGVS